VGSRVISTAVDVADASSAKAGATRASPNPSPRLNAVALTVRRILERGDMVVHPLCEYGSKRLIRCSPERALDEGRGSIECFDQMIRRYEHTGPLTLIILKET
jgi:hypothetical protein